MYVHPPEITLESTEHIILFINITFLDKHNIVMKLTLVSNCHFYNLLILHWN